MSPPAASLALSSAPLVYLSDARARRVLRAAQPFPGVGLADFVIPSADLTELYVFHADGRHVSTRDAVLGTALSNFAYDASGLLMSVTDANGQTTLIERDQAGNPLRIVAPFGLETVITTHPITDEKVLETIRESLRAAWMMLRSIRAEQIDAEVDGGVQEVASHLTILWEHCGASDAMPVLPPHLASEGSAGTTIEAAQAIIRHSDTIFSLINDTIRLVQQRCDEATFRQYRKKAGRVIGHVTAGILFPLWRQHPYLAPDDFK